jgi:integrase
MLLEDVHSDRFKILDSKTESGIRSIPILTNIMQDVERMVQTSKDGYLISGFSSNNKHDNRGKGIGQKFTRHKIEQGFKMKEHIFHSFRSTLATRLQNAKLDPIMAVKLVGHKVQGMTCGLYAGDVDWGTAVEAMAKISYNRAA